MIETARLRLIPFDDAHFQALFQNDLNLLGHLLDVKTPKIWTTYADASDVLPFFYESYKDNGGDWASYFTIHKDDKMLLGTCGFKDAPDTEGVVEIGYEMHEGYRLQGLTTEAAQALVDFAFASSKVTLVRAHTISFSDNPSVSVLKKLGFELIGLFNDPHDGEIWRWEKKKYAQ
jgi:[ribosomal protein S5]-alanine N-acetyltransferase